MDLFCNEARDDCRSVLHIAVRLAHLNRAHCLAEVEITIHGDLPVHETMIRVLWTSVREMQTGYTLLLCLCLTRWLSKCPDQPIEFTTCRLAGGPIFVVLPLRVEI